ncbi:hypothetical protein A2U01_0022154, partial [Trifolium medium]|nr:hypothetical protein [Trifolium medium]
MVAERINGGDEASRSTAVALVTV